MSEKNLITAAGLENLKAELRNLREVERPMIISAISESREHGDLKENSEYHSAKERQSYIEARIGHLEIAISKCKIMTRDNVNTSDGMVHFGATVKLLNVENDNEMTITLVGEYESDISVGKISSASPLGSALAGKKINEYAVVEAPAGNKEYQIISIEYNIL